jgi:hypothetical protein
VEFDPELLAGLKAHTPGVGLADQQVAIAMDAGPEISLAPLARCCGCGRGDRIPLGRDEGTVKTLFQHPAARSDVTAGSGDLILGTVAEGAGAIEKGGSFERSGWNAVSVLAVGGQSMDGHTALGHNNID